MKKRILALVMAGVMALSLAACGGNSDPKSSNSGTADSDFKVGASYINKKTDTAGYTYAHHKGITTAMDELGLDPDSQLVIVDEVPEEDDKVAAAVDTLVGEGCDIIFGISFNYLNAMNAKVRSLSARDMGEESVAVVSVEVRDLVELRGIMNRLAGVRGVTEVRRASS